MFTKVLITQKLFYDSVVFSWWEIQSDLSPHTITISRQMYTQKIVGVACK